MEMLQFQVQYTPVEPAVRYEQRHVEAPFGNGQSRRTVCFARPPAAI